MRVEFTTESRGYMLTLERDLFGAFILYRLLTVSHFCRNLASASWKRSEARRV